MTRIPPDKSRKTERDAEKPSATYQQAPTRRREIERTRCNTGVGPKKEQKNASIATNQERHPDTGKELRMIPTDNSFAGKSNENASVEERKYSTRTSDLNSVETEGSQSNDDSTEESAPHFNDFEAISGLMEDPRPTIPRHGFEDRSKVHDKPQRTPDQNRNLTPVTNDTNMDLSSTIKKLLEEPKSDIHPSKIRFDVSPEAAQENWELLKSEAFDLQKLCNDNGKGKRSLTTYGSEFKSTKKLDYLLKRHPRWKKFRSILENGVNFDLEELEEDMRIADLIEAYKRGNHKSAKNMKEILSKALKKEVDQGWMMILPEECYNEVPGLILNPMGVATHLGVTDTGEFVPKNRVTHDLSFPGKISGSSVNSRVRTSSLEPCMFAHVFLRITHYIVALRQKYPDTRIWIRKEDFKSAFRRLHLNAISALRSAVRVELDGKWYLLVSLRQPFGGSPCPSEFAVAADIVTDTINDLLEDDKWDYKNVYSRTADNIPKANPLPDEVPFHKARHMSVRIHIAPKGKADVYVDDIITIAADLKDNLERITKAPVTVMHAIADNARIRSKDIKRSDMVAMDKMAAEGAPEEEKVCLGWVMNTRSLQVKLPRHKAIAWSAQIEEVLESKTVSSKTLESILGRLENIAQVLTPLGHFLSNIRHLQILAERRGHNVKLNNRVRSDLLLAQAFIKKTQQGVSMNLLTFRAPDIVYICDASEYGMGGFASHGRAWAYTIPSNLRNRAHINILEYLAQIVSIWIDIIEHRLQSEDCVLSIGDNTSSLGWMRRSNFRQKEESDESWEVKQHLGRHLAQLTLDSDIVLYKQWLKGHDNVVADSLSRDHYYLNTNTHKQFLLETVPQQLPRNFSISPIPREISSFITSTLQKLPDGQLQSSRPKPSELARGNIGTLTSIASEWGTCSLIDSMNNSKTQSSQDLPKQSEAVPSLADILHSWWKEQSQPPLHMWHRPSGQTLGTTPDWTEMAKLASCCKNSTEDTGIQMVPKRNRKPFLCQ